MFRGNPEIGMKVPKIFHSTGIDLNEVGTKVFVAPQVSLTDKFGDIQDFNANRPFLFVIECEQTGALLFSGKVVKPEY